MTSELSGPSASVPGARTLSWPRAVLFTAIALYGPQLLMCLYTLGFIACSHCKQMVWLIAPAAPGVFVYESSRRLFSLPHFSSTIGMISLWGSTILVFAGLAAWVRWAGRFRPVLLAIVTVGSGLLALALLGAIRM